MKLKKGKKISTRKSNFPYKRNGIRLVVLEVPGEEAKTRSIEALEDPSKLGTLDDPEPPTTTLLLDGAKDRGGKVGRHLDRLPIFVKKKKC